MNNKNLSKLGKVVDSESGETLIQVFGPPNALTKGAGILSRLLYDLSEVVIRGLRPDSAHGCLGGEFGYGPVYENETFAMRPDYQDVECTCGFSKTAEAWHESHPHSESCYDTELSQIDFDDHEAKRKHNEAIIKRDALPWLSKESDEIQKEVMRWLNKHEKWKDSVLKKLCKKHNIPWNGGYGCMVHCDCGQEELRQDFFSKNNHDSICELILPNFIHKKSGFEVRWYKWIGRDMQTNRDITGEELRQIFMECWESIPQEAREKAQRSMNISFSQEAYTAHLKRRIEHLEAENAAQLGTIKAANDKIIELSKALGKEKDQELPCSKPQPPLPRWQSHKIVEADMIIGVVSFENYGWWNLDCGATIQNPPISRVPKGVDSIGGYFVRYEDGFESWSPSEAFEKGYTRLP